MEIWYIGDQDKIHFLVSKIKKQKQNDSHELEGVLEVAEIGASPSEWVLRTGIRIALDQRLNTRWDQGMPQLIMAKENSRI
jgi:hypothetical protein